MKRDTTESKQNKKTNGKTGNDNFFCSKTTNIKPEQNPVHKSNRCLRLVIFCFCEVPFLGCED